MNSRKLLFLGLIGFYSCMPIKIKANADQDAFWFNYQIQMLKMVAGTLTMTALAKGVEVLVTQYMRGEYDGFPLYKKGSIQTKFVDVIGADAAKNSLKDIIACLQDTQSYQKLGIKLPSGVLLVGQPGNGKTLLARAMAGEAGVNFISVSAADFVGIEPGRGAKEVKKLFKFAAYYSPCIIFIDEIDSVGMQRDLISGETLGILNELLTQLDGFAKQQYSIVVVGATNRLEVLDSALIRPGRLDRIVTVPHPSQKDRAQILELYLKNKTHLLTKKDIARVAQLTVGFSAAELENLVNQAAIFAVKEQAVLSLVSFDQARDLLIEGGEGKTVLTPQVLERIAYHEIGHTLVALHNEPILGSTFHKVTIIPRGGALGATYSLPSEESVFLQTKDQLLAYIRLCLGGYVAEQLMYGQTSTGVSDDLQKASSYAREMVTLYGMNANTGKIFYQLQTCQSGQVYSQETLQKIDTAAQQIVEEQYEWVKAFLTEHKASLKLVGDTLLKEETLTDKQVKELLGIDYSSGELLMA